MINLCETISDYCSSEHYFFLDASMKEHAESILHCFLDKTVNKTDLSFSEIDNALNKVANIDVPLEIRKNIPYLLKEYFGYLSETGKIPQADEWVEHVALLEKKYIDCFRENGTVRGETYQKNYTDVGRNEPCPCGSGRKFKKCCMNLIQ